ADSSAGDRVYALTYESELVNVRENHVTRSESAPSFVLPRDAHYAVVNPVTTLSCDHIDPKFADAHARIDKPELAYSSNVWFIGAVPSAYVAPTAETFLAYESGGTGFPKDVKYVDPLAGTQPIVSISQAISIRKLGEEIGAAIQEEHLITPDTACGIDTFGQVTAALATNLTLGGTALDSDEAVIHASPDSLLDFTWLPTTEHTDIWRIEVGRVLDPTETAPPNPPLAGMYRVYSTQTTVQIPANLFAPGSTYLLRVYGATGAPNAEKGDSVTATYPFVATQIDSHFFTVEP
ncbi:MAG TPA: hypothetical protein VGC41_15350, partial [Kofleriaceae bacterium]